MPRYCPACKVVLSPTERTRGECSDCGATFGDEGVHPQANQAAPLQPVASTGGPIGHVPPSGPHKFLAVVLFLVTLGSFFLPWGTFRSIWDGFAKGETICAAAGCHAAPTEKKEYFKDNLLGPVLEETVHYCKAHLAEAPDAVTVTRGKSISIAVAMVFTIGPAIYVLWFVIALRMVFLEEPGAMAFFLWLAAGGLVAMNALSYLYWHYCHFAFRHSGW